VDGRSAFFLPALLCCYRSKRFGRGVNRRLHFWACGWALAAVPSVSFGRNDGLHSLLCLPCSPFCLPTRGHSCWVHYSCWFVLFGRGLLGTGCNRATGRALATLAYQCPSGTWRLPAWRCRKGGQRMGAGAARYRCSPAAGIHTTRCLRRLLAARYNCFSAAPHMFTALDIPICFLRMLSQPGRRDGVARTP